MRALNVLVRKLRDAMTGRPSPAVEPAPRLFDWETFPSPAGMTPAVPAPSKVSALPSGMPRAAATEGPSGVIGSTIPADVEDFETVYRGAGVTEPAHGYGVDLVGQMLDHSSLVQLDRSVKAQAVLAALDAAGVAIQDVIHDALLRFKALIAFEAAKELETSDIGPRNQARIAQLESEIEAFRAEKSMEIAALVRETSATLHALDRLRQKIRAEQGRFHRAVSLFVEALPAAGVAAADAAAPEPAPAAPEPPAVPTEAKVGPELARK